MAITKIQSTSNFSQDLATVVGAYAANVTAGSVLIALVYLRDTGTLSISDTQSNSWLVAGTPHPGTFGDNTRQSVIAYVFGAKAGATTVTASSSGGGLCDMALHEFGGFTKPRLDGTVYSEGNVSPVSTGTVSVTSGANAVVFAGGVSRSSISTGSDGDGFTVDEQDPNFDGNKSKHLIVSAAGTYGPASFAFSPADSTWVGIAAFTDAAAASFFRLFGP